MGRMKEIYLELWNEHGGEIPPDYTLQDYFAKLNAENEVERRQQEEFLKSTEREENQRNDDSMDDNSHSSQEA
jgi:hypothetical protein